MAIDIVPDFDYYSFIDPLNKPAENKVQNGK